jgi:anthranilate phosphoribosyltransferase
VEIRDGLTSQWEIDPADYGLATTDADELAGGDPADNARIVTAILEGRGNRGARAAVILNAAGAIYVSGRARDFADAVRAAEDAVENGNGLAALERLRAAYARNS